MKTKAQVMAGWVGFCKRYAIENNLDLKKELAVRDECSKEFSWYLSACSERTAEEYLDKRIEKYTRLYSSDTINVGSYDPYWKHRLDFLRWIKSE